MTDSITLFLPAAGLGERLRPITRHIPKPLLPILGKPLLELILEKTASVCSGRVGINLHYKPEMVRDWIGNSPYADRVTFFPEDPILGTGGALKNAGAFLSGGPFMVHNSDILIDLDFPLLVEAHLSSGNIATLVTHQHPRFSNVVIDENDQVIDVENPGESRPDPDRVATKVAYTGIAVYSPEILRFLPGGASHATVAWLAATAAGRAVKVFDVTGCFWNDIGNPATYAAGVLEALRLNGEMVYCSSSAECRAVEADGYVVLESGSSTAEGTRLRNCIVMPGARVSGDHENRIIGPDYVVGLAESEMQPPSNACEQKTVSLSDSLFADYFGEDVRLGMPQAGTAVAVLIGSGGSDRRYFRVKSGQRSAILMECPCDEQNFGRQLAYTAFFESHGISVPRLFAADEAHMRALFEDLGDLSLYSHLRLPREPRAIKDIYRKVMDILVSLHTRVNGHMDECRVLKEQVFDYAHLRWETGYFLEQFVRSLMGMTISGPSSLDREFHRLALIVDAFPKTVIHRDFQSQNIIITKGSIPRVIDYQGARIGPPAYDLASILWDPYYRLKDDLRKELLDFYISKRTAEDEGFSVDDFRTTLLPCRLQRHMQALGAYAFLSQTKGKKHFLKHIKEGLRLLREDVEEAKKDFPALSELVDRL